MFAIHFFSECLPISSAPDLVFQSGNPLFLTTGGEFVIKNLVLISGGKAVGNTVRRLEKNLRSNVKFKTSA